MRPFQLDEHSKRHSGFTVPEGYFENLSEQVTMRLQKESKVIPLSRRRSTWYTAVAAVLVIGLGLAGSKFFAPTATLAPDAVAIENYLATQRSTQDNLAELLENDDLSKMEAGSAPDATVIEDMLARNPNLEQYIIN